MRMRIWRFSIGTTITIGPGRRANFSSHSNREIARNRINFTPGHWRTGGRFAESEQHLRIAEDLAPRDMELSFIAGGVFVWERKYTQAEQTYNSMLALNPNSMTALGTGDCQNPGE